MNYIIINTLTGANKNLIITFLNRIIQNCAIMGRAPILIDNIWTNNGNEFFLQISYFEDVKNDIEPFIKMLKDENEKFYKSIDNTKKP